MGHIKQQEKAFLIFSQLFKWKRIDFWGNNLAQYLGIKYDKSFSSIQSLNMYKSKLIENKKGYLV